MACMTKKCFLCSFRQTVEEDGKEYAICLTCGNKKEIDPNYEYDEETN